MLPSLPGPRFDHECLALGEGDDGIVVIGGNTDPEDKEAMAQHSKEV